MTQTRVGQRVSKRVIDAVRPFQLNFAEAELAGLRRRTNLRRRLNYVQTIVALILVTICMFIIMSAH